MDPHHQGPGLQAGGRRLNRRRGLSFRLRITLGFTLAGMIVSGLVGGATYLLARSYLTAQRTDLVIRQSFNAIRVAQGLTPQGPDLPAEELVTQLQLRGNADVLLVQGERSVASSVSVTPASLPGELLRAVEAGQVAYSYLDTRPRRVAFGSPLPGTGASIYLVHSLRELDSTLSTLATILLAVSGAGVAGSLIVGSRLAARVVEPLRRASEASRRVALGLIDTRLEEERADDLGLLATSFNEMARALQARIARERRFVADASHELRTPLTSLITSLEYLSGQSGRVPGDIVDTVELARRQAESLRRLADELLELSRLEAGVIEVRTDTVDLGTFVKEVVRRRGGDGPVSVKVPEEPVLVNTDKHRLERVVGNLVENALVHGAGRDVGVQVEAGAQGPSITVSDSGPGVPPEQLDHIFDPFWRGDRGRGRRGDGGTGLGLAIARENANLLGADIAVGSTKDEGTRFVVRLPYGEEPPERAR